MDGHNTMIEFYESQAQATRESIENFQKLRDVYARGDDKTQAFLTILIEAHLKTLEHYEGQVETWKRLKNKALTNKDRKTTRKANRKATTPTGQPSSSGKEEPKHPTG